VGGTDSPPARLLWYYRNIMVLPKHGKIVKRKGNTKKTGTTGYWEGPSAHRTVSADTEVGY